MSRMCLALGVAVAAVCEMRSMQRAESMAASWPVSRSEKRSTSLSKRWRIWSGVDFMGCDFIVKGWVGKIFELKGVLFSQCSYYQ